MVPLLVALFFSFLLFQCCLACCSNLCKSSWFQFFLFSLLFLVFMSADLEGPSYYSSQQEPRKFFQFKFEHGDPRGRRSGSGNPFEVERISKKKLMEAYQVLEVTSSASERQIRASFQRLSLKWHPDKNQNDDFAAQKYLEIRTAYDVIKTYKKWK